MGYMGATVKVPVSFRAYKFGGVMCRFWCDEVSLPLTKASSLCAARVGSDYV